MLNLNQKTNYTKDKRRFALRPAQTIIIGFLGIILIGALLLCFPISSKERIWTPFIDSFFTSANAVCVTGLIIFPTATYFSIFGQIVILLLVQIGGLGFMTATTFIMLVIRKKISFKDRLAIQNSLSQDTHKGIIRLVRSILILTFSLELIGCLILMPFICIDNGAAGIWQSLFLSVSAFCNAGFDLFATADSGFMSLSNYSGNAVVCLTVCALIIIGGIGFAVVADVFTKRSRQKKLSVHTKVVLYFTAFLIAAGTIFFLALEYNNPLTLGNKNFFEKLLAAFFQSVTSRTAGFSTVDQAALHPASKIFTSILMFIGASPGSTGGGVKTTTLALIFITLISVMRGKDEIVVFKHKINYKTVFKAFSIFFLGLLLILVLSIIILIAEADNPILQSLNLYSLNNIIFEAVSVFSTTGISTGITHYLSPVSKIAYIAVMFIGRVGLMNFGLAFFLDKNNAVITYPESNIIVG